MVEEVFFCFSFKNSKNILILSTKILILSTNIPIHSTKIGFVPNSGFFLFDSFFQIQKLLIFQKKLCELFQNWICSEFRFLFFWTLFFKSNTNLFILSKKHRKSFWNSVSWFFYSFNSEIPKFQNFDPKKQANKMVRDKILKTLSRHMKRLGIAQRNHLKTNGRYSVNFDLAENWSNPNVTVFTFLGTFITTGKVMVLTTTSNEQNEINHIAPGLDPEFESTEKSNWNIS